MLKGTLNSQITPTVDVTALLTPFQQHSMHTSGFDWEM